MKVLHQIGFLLNNTTYTANLEYKNQNTPVVVLEIKDVVNKEPTGEISIVKEDVDTGNSARFDGEYHHGDATIEGTVYTLYANEDIYNVNRTIKYFSKDDELGTYTFDKKGIATAKVTNTSTKANLVASGSKISQIPIGMYYSKETKAGTGYVLDTEKHIYNLQYKDSATDVVTFNAKENDRVQKAKFEVIKISSIKNNTAKVIEGAEFTAILERYVKKYGSFKEAQKHLSEFAEDEYSVFKTGSNGHGVSSLLAYGKYVVNETFTPSPEINTVEEFKVTIDEDSDTPIKEFVENDTPFESYLKIIKIDSETGKTITFSNATFSLYKQNDNNEWEKVKCKVGNKYVDNWTTDENGVASTETKLAAGKYKIDEIKVPDKYIKLEKDVIFELNNDIKDIEYDDDYDAHITVTVGNEEAKGNLNITKTVKLRQNVDTTLIKDIDYTKISFGLYAREDILDPADGEIIYQKGTKIGEYNLDKDGKLSIENLHLGTYFLKELKTIDGAALDTKEYDVIFTQEDNTTKNINVNLNIENQTTITEFSKTTITGDGELEGAKLQVYDSEGSLIDEWVSQKDKTHLIEGLKPGKFILREEIAPDNYVKATDVEFEVLDTYEIQKVTMVDKVVAISKTDITTGEELPGANLKIVDEDGNIVEEWVSTDTPHYTSNLEENHTYTLIETTCPYRIRSSRINYIYSF